MADNVAITAGSGTNIATDDISGVHYQYVKLVDGTADATGKIGGDATNGLDVDVTRLPALPAGTNNIGDVDVLTLPSIPAGTNNIGDVDVLTLPSLPSGNNNIGDVDVVSSVLSTNRTASGALGALNAAVTMSGEGAQGILWEVDTGTLVGTVVFEATLDDSNWFAVNAIRVDGTIITSITSFSDRGALTSVGYSQVRLRVSAYTSGTSNARMEANRGGNVVRLGQALPPGTNNIGDVDVLTLPSIPAGSNNIGDVDVLTLPSLPSGTNNIGDVDVLTLPALPSGTNNIGDVDVLTLPAIPAGNNNIGDVDLAQYTPTDVDTGGGTDNALPVALRLPASGGGVNAPGDSTNGLDVDVTRLPSIPAGTNNIGDVDVLTLPALPAGTNNIGDVDVLTLPALPAGTNNIGDVDVLTLPALPAGTNNIGDVDVLTLPALPAGSNNIGDVDVLTTVMPANRTASGALGSLNAAVTMSCEGARGVTWEIDTGNLVGTVVFEATLDDSNWFAVNAVRIDGSIVSSVNSFSTRGAFSSVSYSQIRLRVSAYTSGTSNARTEASLGGEVVRLGQALPAGTNNIGDVDVLTLPGIAGDVAHDTTDSGNPVKVGGQARQTNPTAVADADRANIMVDDVGRQVVVMSHVRDLVTKATTTISNTTETTILAAVASTFLDLTLLIITNTSATATRVDIRDDTGGSVIFSVAIAANGGAVIPFNTPLPQGTVNKNWTAQLSGAVTDIRIFAVAVKNV